MAGEGELPVYLPVYLQDLSYPAALALRERSSVVLIPVGATEAHGPHLPLGTDVFLSEELARRVQRQLAQRGTASAIAPSLAYAVTDFGAPFAGTVSLDAETALAFYVGLLSGFLRAGFFRLCLVNSHLESAHVATLGDACAEVAKRSGVAVAFPDNTERRWARTLTDEFKRGSCHAGRYETSLLLAGPQAALVDEAQRRALLPNEIDLVRAMREGATDFVAAGAPNAYFGDPAAATAAEGDDIYARLTAMVLTVIDETWPAGAS
jgi:creatinine amidohydrolase